MSEFSQFCNILREKSGMTIYQIAKVSGMERTALNRMVLGKRFPKREDMELFCEAIRANDKEKEKLRELYMMEKMGKRRYENCQYIRRLLKKLDRLEGAADRVLWVPDGAIEPDPEFCPLFVQGREEIEKLLYFVLEQAYRQEKVPEMYTNFPAKEEMLPSAVQYFSGQFERDIPLFHYHILNVNPEEYYDADCNLKVLYHTLSWKFREGVDYRPYYTYSPIMLHDLEWQLMPFYLVTDSCVLLASGDFRQGILLDDTESAALYQRKMKKRRNQLQPLFWPEDCIVNTEVSNGRGLRLKHLNIQFFEKAVRIETYQKGEKHISVVIKESSLCESFQYFLNYVTELKSAAHISAHIEGQAAEDI